MSAAADLLKNYQHIIDQVALVTGGAGIFDVEVDGELLYSKTLTRRHAEPGEILSLFTQRYAPDIPRYGS